MVSTLSPSPTSRSWTRTVSDRSDKLTTTSSRSVGEQHARREAALGVQRAPRAAHGRDPGLAVELAEEGLLHRVAAGAVLGEGAAAEAGDLAPELEEGLL